MNQNQPIDFPTKPLATHHYGGFWARLGALLLDTFILVPFTLTFLYFNITQWKSSFILIVVSLLSIVYKPFFEHYFAATPGKMALGLKVVNLQYEKATLQEILLRNIFQITVPLVSLLVTLQIFNSPEFQEVNGFMEYITLTAQSQGTGWYNNVSSLIYVVDGILLLSDDRKRSLHDRIGKTFVIEKSS